MFAPLILIATTTLAGDRAEFAFRVAAGTEWDTNVRRAISDDTRRSITGDGVARLVADAHAHVAIADGHAADVGYVLGTKRFFNEATEDLLVHNLSLSTGHAFTDTLTSGIWGSLRASRMRSGERDYSIAAFGGGAAVHPLDVLSLGASASFTHFVFELDDRLSYAAPALSAEVTVRPFDRFSIGARLERAFRNYQGNALVPATVQSEDGPIEVATYCDGSDDLEPPACTPVARDDREWLLSLKTAYRGRIRVSLEYLLRVQRSSSTFENIDRHRVFAHGAFPLFLEVTGNVSAALQINSGVSITDTRFLAEDDENQNSLQLGLARRVMGPLGAEVRYALFANQFTTARVSFLRQIFYAGLSYRIGD